MINPAAILGLENSESYKQLGQIKTGIEVLIKHKARDYDEERKHFKHEQEMDKRERQDLKFIQEKEAAEVVKYQKFMKSTDGGITAALLGGAAILGVLTAIGSIDIGKLVGDIWNGIKEFFGFSSTPQEQAEVEESATQVETGETSGTEALSTAAEGDGTPLPMPKGVSKGSPPGYRIHPISGGRKYHNGWDMPAPTGTPLTIKGNGKVVAIGSQGNVGYGKWITIKDSRGEHFYAHLSKYGKFKEGDSIKTGDIVAYTGNSGGSTGPHLHWEFDSRTDKAGNRRSPSDVMDPLQHGYKWTTPFTGLQTGGVAGKGIPSSAVAATALPIIKHHEALSSLTPGVNDYIFHGGNSVKSKTPWAKASKPDTKIYAYPDGGGVPTIGWGSIYNDSMMKGSSKVKMGDVWAKKKADDKLKKDTLELLKYLRAKHPHYNKMTLKQQAGFLSQHYNTGAYTATDSNKYPVFKKHFRAGQIHKAADNHPRSGGPQFASRIADEQKYMKAGPAVVAAQRGGAIGKKGGGIVNLNMRPHMQDNTQYYDNNFFVRQGRKATSTPIIMVNNIAMPHQSTAIPSHSEVSGGVTNATQLSYTDIAQTYYRYIRGIKA
jgi:murein DD-endopeptidase MepM/ murein hydrolase activator NlpD/GH24 family phage-related lysozyme (muramidase)